MRFCDFEEVGVNFYVCKTCGIRIESEDGPPPMVCQSLMLEQTSDTESVPTISLAKKITNFIQAGTQHLKHGAKMCTEEQVARRYDICTTCPYFIDNTCAKCGCPLYRHKKFISKLSWADQECPVGRWRKEV